MSCNERTVKAILLNADDSVVVLPFGGRKGDVLPDGTARLLSDIQPGHKVARANIPAGAPILKYGESIGTAVQAIPAGSWVHDHNIQTNLSEHIGIAAAGKTEFSLSGWRAACERGGGCSSVFREGETFLGYARPNGGVGIRNELWILPTVGCINAELKAIIKAYQPPAWIDRVQVLEHPYGCSQLGDDLGYTESILAALAEHPNAAGVVVVGLGCENLSCERLMRRIDNPLARSVILQEESADRLISLMHELADGAARERVAMPISKLVVGVKCGGSDGFSGLTANPLVGRFSDGLVYRGGTVVATEIPEMFGAEQVILRRVANRKVGDGFLGLAQWFRDYYIRYRQPVYENPSPGNRQGGISTLEEKSLGAIEKFGGAPIVGALGYGGVVERDAPGVHILFGPGNDLVSSTILAAAGAQAIIFTTGRGTPFGGVVPTVKVSSNTRLFERKKEWIDFDAGALLQGDSDWDGMTAALGKLVLDIANGSQTKNEQRGIFGLAIFKDGAIL